MKHSTLIAVAIFFFVSCSKDKTGAAAYVVPPAGSNATVKYSGFFYGTQGIEVKGSAKIILTGAEYQLALDSFLVTAGPDLKVYLSKKDTPFEFINLGPLKSNSNSQTYALPAGIDFAAHKYALVHCQQFNHLFAIAELKP